MVISKLPVLKIFQNKLSIIFITKFLEFSKHDFWNRIFGSLSLPPSFLSNNGLKNRSAGATEGASGNHLGA